MFLVFLHFEKFWTKGNVENTTPEDSFGILVVTEVPLKINVLWYVTPFVLVRRYRFDRCTVWTRKKLIFSELLFLKMKPLRSFEMSLTIYQPMRRNVAEDLNFPEDFYVLIFGLQNVFCAVEISTSFSFVRKYSAFIPKHCPFIKSCLSYK